LLFRRLFLVTLAACALAFTGCATVPDTQFLKKRYRTQSAEFKTAFGPLTQRRADAILADLKRKSGGGTLDILDRQLALEQVVSGSPLVLGNKVTLLLDGPATYTAMFAAMSRAKHSINVETYIIQDDEMGRAFADLLIQRRSDGIEVNLIYDGAGALWTSKDYFERLRKAGIRTVEFNPLNPLSTKIGWAPNHRDHRKLLIVDGQVAILGGINIDSVYSSNPSGGGSGRSNPPASGGSGSGSRVDPETQRKSGWRDTDVQLEGPVVTDLQKLFLQTWEKQHGPPLVAADYLPVVPVQGKEIVRAIPSSPDDRISAIYLTLVAAITHAEKQVYITNAYFVPDPQLVEALISAAKRGVDVRLILPGTTDAQAVGYAARSHYTELLQGGVKIYERHSALLHAKTAVIDGVWTCVGSANLDWRSAVDNDELNVVILSREFAQQMVHAYRLDQNQSDQINLTRWLKRPWSERVKESFFRLCGRAL
jgi:cardiolipin synthase